MPADARDAHAVLGVQGTSDQSSLLGRREEARLERVRSKGKQQLFDD